MQRQAEELSKTRVDMQNQEERIKQLEESLAGASELIEQEMKQGFSSNLSIVAAVESFGKREGKKSEEILEMLKIANNHVDKKHLELMKLLEPKIRAVDKELRILELKDKVEVKSKKKASSSSISSPSIKLN